MSLEAYKCRVNREVSLNYQGVNNNHPNAKNYQIGERHANELKYTDVIGANPLTFSNRLALDRPLYNDVYNQKGWAARKLQAIPKALYSGVIKSICHLVKAILFVMIGRFESGKANLFSSARDLQEAAGWIRTLTNDKEGSYLIATATFMKSCYDIKINVGLRMNNPILLRRVEEIAERIWTRLDDTLIQIADRKKDSPAPQSNFAFSAEFVSLNKEYSIQMKSCPQGAFKDAVLGHIWGVFDSNYRTRGDANSSLINPMISYQISILPEDGSNYIVKGLKGKNVFYTEGTYTFDPSKPDLGYDTQEHDLHLSPANS